MKRYTIIIMIVAVLSCILCACSPRGHFIPGSNINDFGEWVSPDGVHYWRTAYNMAPRYDNNGDLVIDSE